MYCKVRTGVDVPRCMGRHDSICILSEQAWVGWENQCQDLLHKQVNQLLVADAAIVPVSPDGVSRYLVSAPREGTRFCNLGSMRMTRCR